MSLRSGPPLLLSRSAAAFPSISAFRSALFSVPELESGWLKEETIGYLLSWFFITSYSDRMRIGKSSYIRRDPFS